MTRACRLWPPGHISGVQLSQPAAPFSRRRAPTPRPLESPRAYLGVLEVSAREAGQADKGGHGKSPRARPAEKRMRFERSMT